MLRKQAFSGLIPFEGLRNEAVILPVRSGNHPSRPEGGSDLGLTDELWDMMKACWKRRDRRWKISRIVSTLKYHSAVAETTDGCSQSGRGSGEAAAQPAHKANPHGYSRRARQVFSAIFHK